MLQRWILPVVLIVASVFPSVGWAEKIYNSSYKSFVIPSVKLTTQDDEAVKLDEFLPAHEPYVLSFIFTTCTTVCPIMSATMSHLHRELGEDAGDLNLVSISIDPEYDSPLRLHDYAQRYRAGKLWTFLTGSLEDIQTVQRTFTGFVSDKMDHWPVYILKAPGAEQWLVIDGLLSGRDLAREYRQMMNTVER